MTITFLAILKNILDAAGMGEKQQKQFLKDFEELVNIKVFSRVVAGLNKKEKEKIKENWDDIQKDPNLLAKLLWDLKPAEELTRLISQQFNEEITACAQEFVRVATPQQREKLTSRLKKAPIEIKY